MIYLRTTDPLVRNPKTEALTPKYLDGTITPEEKEQFRRYIVEELFNLGVLTALVLSEWPKRNPTRNNGLEEDTIQTVLLRLLTYNIVDTLIDKYLDPNPLAIRNYVGRAVKNLLVEDLTKPYGAFYSSVLHPSNGSLSEQINDGKDSWSDFFHDEIMSQDVSHADWELDSSHGDVEVDWDSPWDKVVELLHPVELGYLTKKKQNRDYPNQTSTDRLGRRYIRAKVKWILSPEFNQLSQSDKDLIMAPLLSIGEYGKPLWNINQHKAELLNSIQVGKLWHHNIKDTKPVNEYVSNSDYKEDFSGQPLVMSKEYDQTFAKLNEQFLQDKIKQENKVKGVSMSGARLRGGIDMYNLDGNFQRSFSSLSEASEHTVINKMQISNVCKKRQASTGGKIFRYSEETNQVAIIDIVIPERKTRQRIPRVPKEPRIRPVKTGNHNQTAHWLRTPVYQYDKSGIFLNSYISLTHAREATGLQHIGNAIRVSHHTAGGCFWRKERVECLDINAITGKANTQYNKQVHQYSTEGVFLRSFSTVKEAAVSAELTYNLILANIRDRQKTAGGFIWKGFKVDRLEPELSINEQKNQCHQYNLDGSYSNSFPSATQAAKALKVSGKLISACIRNPMKLGVGYLWRGGEKQDHVSPYIKIEKVKPVKIKQVRIKKVKERKPKGQQVHQYSKDGNYMASFPSIQHAAKETSTACNSISMVVNGWQHSAGDFYWSKERTDEYKAASFRTRNRVFKSKKKDLSYRNCHQYTKDGVYIQTFENMARASEQLGIHRASIEFCAKGKNILAGGFTFRTGELHEKIEVRKRPKRKAPDNKRSRPVAQLDQDGNVLQVFPKIKDAAKAMKGSDSHLGEVLRRGIGKTFKGYKWKFYEPETELSETA